MENQAKVVEAIQPNNKKETIFAEKIIVKELHSKKYLDNLRETTYKNKKVVFILPNGKEY